MCRHISQTFSQCAAKAKANRRRQFFMLPPLLLLPLPLAELALFLLWRFSICMTATRCCCCYLCCCVDLAVKCRKLCRTYTNTLACDSCQKLAVGRGGRVVLQANANRDKLRCPLPQPLRRHQRLQQQNKVSFVNFHDGKEGDSTKSHTHTHARGEVCVSVVGEGGRRTRLMFKSSAKLMRVCVRVCVSVGVTVCLCMGVCVCWDAVAVTASAAAASERVATFSFVLRARGGCPLDDKFFRTHTLLMLFLLLPTVQERKTNTKLPVF